MTGPVPHGVPNGANALFESSLEWLRASYSSYRFFAERDVVWTVQLRLLEMIEKHELPHRVFSGYPMGARQSADLVILNNASDVEVAVEFKYEPLHLRGDFPQTGKFPVCFWGPDGVGKDVERCRDFVARRSARSAYSVLIDEGAYFRHRPAHEGTEWVDWSGGVCALLGRFVETPR